MQRTPIERLGRFLLSLKDRIDPERDTCCWCHTRGTMTPSSGGYWYCSTACEDADAEHQEAQI